MTIFQGKPMSPNHSKSKYKRCIFSSLRSIRYLYFIVDLMNVNWSTFVSYTPLTEENDIVSIINTILFKIISQSEIHILSN